MSIPFGYQIYLCTAIDNRVVCSVKPQLWEGKLNSIPSSIVNYLPVYLYPVIICFILISSNQSKSFIAWHPGQNKSEWRTSAVRVRLVNCGSNSSRQNKSAVPAAWLSRPAPRRCKQLLTRPPQCSSVDLKLEYGRWTQDYNARISLLWGSVEVRERVTVSSNKARCRVRPDLLLISVIRWQTKGRPDHNAEFQQD